MIIPPTSMTGKITEQFQPVQTIKDTSTSINQMDTSIVNGPEDVLLMIFKSLSAFPLSMCRITCKRWRRIIDCRLLNIPQVESFLSATLVLNTQLNVHYTGCAYYLNISNKFIYFDDSFTILEKKWIETSQNKKIVLEPWEKLDKKSLNEKFYHYLTHSEKEVFIAGSLVINIIHLETGQIRKLDISDVWNYIQIKNEDLRNEISAYPYISVTTAIINANTLVTLSHGCIIAKWDLESLQCIQAKIIFSIPNTKEIRISPSIIQFNNVGSSLIVSGQEGIMNSSVKEVNRFSIPEEEDHFIKYGAIYTVNLNTFSCKRIHQSPDPVYKVFNKYLIISKPISTSVFELTSKSEWCETKRIKEIKTLYDIENTTPYGLIKEIKYGPAGSRAFHDFELFKCYNLKIRDGVYFIVNHWVIIVLGKPLEKVLHFYVPPIAKEIGSYPLSKICNHEIHRIDSIRMNNNQLSILYEKEDYDVISSRKKRNLYLCLLWINQEV